MELDHQRLVFRTDRPDRDWRAIARRVPANLAVVVNGLG
jgi:hypothetical protein